MIDSVIESFGDEADVVSELHQRRQAILEDREQLKLLCAPVFEVLDRPDVKEAIEANRGDGGARTLEYLEQKHEVCVSNRLSIMDEAGCLMFMRISCKKYQNYESG
jgi:excinuclease UvrABC helicase subunit UvrB